MAISSLEQLMTADVGGGFEPIPNGWYDGVITGTDTNKGKKAPYLTIKVTVHDEEHQGAVVWGMASFSTKAEHIPGNIPNLLQSTSPKIDLDTPKEEIPNAVAAAVKSIAVRIKVKNEQVVRNGIPQTLDDDETPEMRSKIDEYAPATEEFYAKIKNEESGVDDSLPF